MGCLTWISKEIEILYVEQWKVEFWNIAMVQMNWEYSSIVEILKRPFHFCPDPLRLNCVRGKDHDKVGRFLKSAHYCIVPFFRTHNGLWSKEVVDFVASEKAKDELFDSLSIFVAWLTNILRGLGGITSTALVPA